MRSWRNTWGLLAWAIGLGACGSTLPHPPYSAQPESALVEVLLPPPPGRIEVIPARPHRGAVWVDGEWMWRRRRWAWLPGRWVDLQAGATYSPAVFVRGQDGRLWSAPGTWRSASGATVTAPPPLVAARVESTEVLNAAGDTLITGLTLPATGPTRNASPAR